MTEHEPEVIQSYDAKVHWSQVLDRVGRGHHYIVSKHHRQVAVLVPLAEWQALTSRDAQDTPEARELAAMVERLEAQNAATGAALDDAFAEIAKTREQLAALRAQRREDPGQ
ncbi:type II toxin-antitoxin system prevent-host-death family antitoxin [Sediminicurvatus halobius]|nr:type II toxin-antitoxin system prevent-host-death family antitoxin [Spiribacter halobius]UEX78553.1 type II toxin-antitoxin system prevent-host-death family antitoxin [Spiribacter halobius]